MNPPGPSQAASFCTVAIVNAALSDYPRSMVGAKRLPSPSPAAEGACYGHGEHECRRSRKPCASTSSKTSWSSSRSNEEEDVVARGAVEQLLELVVRPADADPCSARHRARGQGRAPASSLAQCVRDRLTRDDGGDGARRRNVLGQNCRSHWFHRQASLCHCSQDCDPDSIFFPAVKDNATRTYAPTGSSLPFTPADGAVPRRRRRWAGGRRWPSRSGRRREARALRAANPC